jgi:uncharacterized protein YneF (UPF0154 family)
MTELAAVPFDSAELAGQACCLLYLVLVVAVPAVVVYGVWLALRAMRKYTRRPPASKP